MLNILHCVTDDKFIDDIIDVFEHIKGEYQFYYSIVGDKRKPYSCIKKQEYIVNIPKTTFLNYLAKNKIDVVIIHGIGAMPPGIINIIPSNIKVMWKSWGYDIYRCPSDYSPLAKVDLYHRYTQIERLKDFKANVSRLKMHIYYLLHRKGYREAISRVDFFSGVIPDEYDLIAQRHYSFFRARHTFYPYFSLNSNQDNNDFVSLGENIVLGNSAAFPNNHIDILHQLKKVELKNKRIVMPISYQRNERYVQAIKKYANKYFQGKIDFLENFIPYEQYIELLNSCGYAIYGNEQQAAMGNIFLSIYEGKKVFLSNTSIVYKYFKRIGLIVYSIQDDLTEESLSHQLSEQEKVLNRQLYLEHYSTERCMDYVHQMISEFEK